jgi:hypothetical protein
MIQDNIRYEDGLGDWMDARLSVSVYRTIRLSISYATMCFTRFEDRNARWIERWMDGWEGKGKGWGGI